MNHDPFPVSANSIRPRLFGRPGLFGGRVFRLRLGLSLWLSLGLSLGLVVAVKGVEARAAVTGTASPRAASARPEMDVWRARVQAAPGDHKAQLKLGTALLQQHQWDEALIHLRKANEEPTPESLRALAVLFKVKKDNLQLIRALEDLTMLKARDYRAYTQLADAYVLTDKFDKAIENYRKALDIYVRYRPAYQGLIHVYQLRKNIFEIRNVLGTMLENFPQDSGVLVDLCRYYALDSLFDKGLEYCKLAMQKNPRNPDSRVFYGLMENGKYGDRKGTPRILETAKKFPRSSFAQISAAKVSADDKMWEASARYYRAATQLNLKDGDAWLGVAQSEFSAGNYADALRDYLKACPLNFRANNELIHATGILGVQKEEKWYRRYRDAQDKCAVHGN